MLVLFWIINRIPLFSHRSIIYEFLPEALYSAIPLFLTSSIHTTLALVLFKVPNSCDLGPPQSTCPGPSSPERTFQLAKIQRTEPAGIWHFSDISIRPSPFFVHTPTCKQYDGFTQNLRFFLTMADWEAHNLLQGTGSIMQDFKISHAFRSPTLYYEKEKYYMWDRARRRNKKICACITV